MVGAIWWDKAPVECQHWLVLNYKFHLSGFLLYLDLYTTLQVILIPKPWTTLGTIRSLQFGWEWESFASQEACFYCGKTEHQRFDQMSVKHILYYALQSEKVKVPSLSSQHCQGSRVKWRALPSFLSLPAAVSEGKGWRVKVGIFHKITLPREGAAIATQGMHCAYVPGRLVASDAHGQTRVVGSCLARRANGAKSQEESWQQGRGRKQRA